MKNEFKKPKQTPYVQIVLAMMLVMAILLGLDAMGLIEVSKTGGY